jgi:hypothetical protein
MKKIQILFITFSNTTEERSLLFKDLPVTVRPWDWELDEDIQKIVGKDRPRLIVYDGNFYTNQQLNDFHEDILKYISQYDVDCQVCFFEKDLKLRGTSLIKIEDFKEAKTEPTK